MVNFTPLISTVLAATSLINNAVAHPGEKHDLVEVKRQVDAQYLRAAAARRSLSACQGSLKHRSLMSRSVDRRANILKDLRARKGITVGSKKYRRDLATLQKFEAVNHNMTGQVDYTFDTPASELFAANTSCILSPEVTNGPYYVTGEYVRKDVTEGQSGVPMYLEVQYIDITNCEAVPDLYIDIWNANATGFYSGVAGGQGGLNSTFLRGVQETDEDGVVGFETIFPGHYDGRATHTHVLTKSNVTVRENGTTGAGGAVTHIGQIFYPEDLKTAVGALAPYNTNTQAYTTNDEDMWTIVQAADDFDPFPQFVYVGDDLSAGLFAWIQIGINSTADHSNESYYSVAADYQAGGGVAKSEGGMGGGSGNGTMPSGAMPSGAVPSGAAPSGAAPSGAMQLSSSLAGTVAPVASVKPSVLVSTRSTATTVVTSARSTSSAPVSKSGAARQSGRPSANQPGQQGPSPQQSGGQQPGAGDRHLEQHTRASDSQPGQPSGIPSQRASGIANQRPGVSSLTRSERGAKPSEPAQRDVRPQYKGRN